MTWHGVLSVDRASLHPLYLVYTDAYMQTNIVNICLETMGEGQPLSYTALDFHDSDLFSHLAFRVFTGTERESSKHLVPYTA